jgi:hypothetical protein
MLLSNNFHQDFDFFPLLIFPETAVLAFCTMALPLSAGQATVNRLNYTIVLPDNPSAACKLAGSGDPNLHLIEWDQVLNRFSRLSADLIHPSPAGHQMMGPNLAALLCRWGSDL